MANCVDYTGDTLNVGDFCTIFGTLANVSGNNVNVTCIFSGLNITVPFQGSQNASSNVNSPSLSGAGKTQTPSLIPVGEQMTVKGTLSTLSGSLKTSTATVLLADGVTTVTCQAGDVYNTQNA